MFLFCKPLPIYGKPTPRWGWKKKLFQKAYSVSAESNGTLVLFSVVFLRDRAGRKAKHFLNVTHRYLLESIYYFSQWKSVMILEKELELKRFIKYNDHTSAYFYYKIVGFQKGTWVNTILNFKEVEVENFSYIVFSVNIQITYISLNNFAIPWKCL